MCFAVVMLFCVHCGGLHLFSPLGLTGGAPADKQRCYSLLCPQREHSSPHPPLPGTRQLLNERTPRDFKLLSSDNHVPLLLCLVMVWIILYPCNVFPRVCFGIRTSLFVGKSQHMDVQTLEGESQGSSIKSGLTAPAVLLSLSSCFSLHSLHSRSVVLSSSFWVSHRPVPFSRMSFSCSVETKPIPHLLPSQPHCAWMVPPLFSL